MGFHTQIFSCEAVELESDGQCCLLQMCPFLCQCHPFFEAPSKEPPDSHFISCTECHYLCEAKIFTLLGRLGRATDLVGDPHFIKFPFEFVMVSLTGAWPIKAPVSTLKTNKQTRFGRHIVLSASIFVAWLACGSGIRDVRVWIDTLPSKLIGSLSLTYPWG